MLLIKKKDIPLLQWIRIMKLTCLLLMVAIPVSASEYSKLKIEDNRSKELILQVEQQKEVTISGTVSDETGELLPGVSVVIKGSNRGTATNFDGVYTLEAPVGSTLIFSYIGYKTEERLVELATTIDVQMKIDSEEIEEVVVTALGIKRKTKALGYSVQEIQSEDLNEVKSVNFVNSLSGKVAGVTINANSSGVGGATKVVMRGPASLAQDNNVLYVIDGVPIFNPRGGNKSGIFAGATSGEGISDLNSEDIESMSVLTGPAAAALYGSSAANGAIIITTKKGKEGKLEVSYSHTTEFMNPFVSPRFQNKYGNNPGEFKSWLTEPLANALKYDPINDFYQTGTNVMHSLSVTTGTERNQTFVSFASTDAEGIVPNNLYNRMNFTARNTAKFFENRMTMDVGFNYINQGDQNLVAQGQYFNPIVAAYLFPRGESFDNVRAFERWDVARNISTQYWPYGGQGLTLQNPFWTAYRNLFTSDKDRYMINASLKYEINDWMNISTRLRLDDSQTDRRTKFYASTFETYSGPNGHYRLYNEKNTQLYTDAMLNVNKQIAEDWHFSGTLGASLSDIDQDASFVMGNLNQIPNFFAIQNLVKDNTSLTQSGWREQTQSVFASTEFGYKSMVYLTVTGRNDWASMLANTNNVSFFYPSVGLSGVISEMTQLPELINFLKVRASYAEVGLPPKRHLSTPTYDLNQGGVPETITSAPVTDLKPENTKSYEFGFNMRALKGMMNLDVTLYNAISENQTFTPALSASSGYTSVVIQTGAVQNKGIEATLGFNNTWNDFNWSSNVIYTRNKNEILELVEGFKNPITGELIDIPQLTFEGGGGLDYLTIVKKGGTISDLYTRNALVRDHNGDIYVGPTNGLLQVTNNALQKVGTALPDYMLSWNNSFSYKGFFINALIAARVGGVVISATQGMLDQYGVSEASAQARENGGVPVNNGLMDTEYYYSVTGGSAMLSNYVYSATNVRLQEFVFGYDIPRKFLWDKFDARVSMTGRNLFMFYNKAPFDPEQAASTGTYGQGIDYFMQPSTRNIGFNMNVKF